MVKKLHMKWVLHEYPEGVTEWETVGDPYIHPEHRVWTVDCKGKE